MIILCPSCSDPFQLLPANIAPLVQVACPRCTYQVILDFEAVNNSTLREEGMQTTQGFRSMDDYQKFAATLPAGAAHREPPTSPPVQPPTSILPSSGKISSFQPADKEVPTPAEESAAAQRRVSGTSETSQAKESFPPLPTPPRESELLHISQTEERIGAGAILGVLIALMIALMILSYFLRGSWNPLHLLTP